MNPITLNILRFKVCVRKNLHFKLWKKESVISNSMFLIMILFFTLLGIFIWLCCSLKICKIPFFFVYLHWFLLCFVICLFYIIHFSKKKNFFYADKHDREIKCCSLSFFRSRIFVSNLSSLTTF